MGELVVGLQGGDKGARALVTDRGELVVASLAYSDPYYADVNLADTPFIIVPAKANRHFVITGLLLASDKDFATATTAETLVIYEANPADLGTNLRTVTQVDFLRNDRLVATGLNIKTD